MRQKNVFPYALVLPTVDPPVEVQPGGELDHDGLLAGFEPVNPPAPAPAEPKPVAAPPVPPPAPAAPVAEPGGTTPAV